MSFLSTLLKTVSEVEPLLGKENQSVAVSTSPPILRIFDLSLSTLEGVS